MYLIIYYFCVFINLLIFITLIYVALQQSKKKYSILKVPIQIVRIIIPLTSTTFFLPIFFIFMSAFDCTKKKTNLYTDELKCFSLIYYINCIISIISLLLFIPINLIALSIFYEYSLGDSKNVLSKTTSKPDFFFAVSKIIVTVIFVALDGDEDIHYVLIITLNIFTFLNMCYNFLYPRFNEVILIFMNQFLSFTLWWASFILLIGKFTRHKKFDGCMGIFFVTEPIFCFIILLKNNKNFHRLINNFKHQNSPDDLLSHIKTLIYLIDNKDVDRISFVTLKGYIVLYEENCTLKDCPLKKYNNSIKYGNDGKAFLYQHIELLFSFCESKFPNSIEVRFSYALFLLQKMNKRKQASELLKGIEELNLSLEQQFNIFRCKKMIDDELYEILGDNSSNLDLMKELEYKNLNVLFINLIINASNLYIDFWSQLLSSHSSGSEDLTKLNECGTKINKVVKDIDLIFDKMQKIKNNDIECIKNYSDFINEVLNDKEKGLKYKMILNELGDLFEIPQQIEFENINLGNLSLNDKFQYIIVSGNEETFGLINRISLSVTEIFGFEYGELIGKNLDIIMPEIYHKEHKKVLKNSINEFKRKYIEESTKNTFTPKEIKTFGRNKSKYLIELDLKVKLIHTENNELFFACSVLKESAFYHTNNNGKNDQICYIMTNKNLIIQNFSANGISYLGLSSTVINNNVEITYFIKQFYEDFLQLAIENGQLTSEQKLSLKKNILNKKYKTPNNIIWRRLDSCDSKYNSSKLIELKHSIFPKNKTYNNNSYLDDYFTLIVSDIIINKKLIGYIFKFEKSDYKLINSTKILPLTSNLSKNKPNIKHNNTYYKLEKANYDALLNNNSTNSNNNNNKLIVPNLNIDYNYIPNSTFNFKLNINDLTYEGVDETGNDSLREYMKNEVMREIEEENQREALKKKLEEEEDEEEEEEINEDDDSDIQSSSNVISDNKISDKNIINKTQSMNTQNTNLKNILNKSKVEDEYYKVNCSKIKFLKYDYSKNMLTEIKDYEKISQVEKRMQEGKMSKEGEQNSNPEINLTQNNFSINTNQNLKLGNDNQNTENPLIKEIEYALKKQESQESIYLLNKMSFIAFILLISMGCISLYYILHSAEKSKKIGTLVTNSYRLLILNSVGVYYVKELILLNNENYTSIPSRSNREEYIQMIYNKSMDLFIQSHNLISESTSSTLTFSKKNYKILYEDLIETENIILSNLTVKKVKTTMQSAFLEAQTALFNIVTKKIDLIIQSEQDTFFYIKNSLNILMIAYKKQGETYLDELKQIINYLEIILIIGFVSIFFIIIGIYFLINYAYNKVAQKKKSYIEVFFEIGTSVIKNSLDKCENFSKKLHYEEDDFDSSINFENNYNEENIINSNENVNENDNNKIQRGTKKLESSRIFKIRFGFFLSLVMAFFIILFILFYLYLENIIINETYFQKELIIESCFYEIFNSLREYLFDMNSKVNLNNSYNTLHTLLEDIYVIRKNSFAYMNPKRKYLPYNFIEKYNIMNAKSPCDFRTNQYFLNEEDCLLFINGATRYGIIILNSYYIEEIRFMKEISLVYIDITKPMNNLSTTGLEINAKNWPTDINEMENYIKNDPINFFNLESVSDLNILMSSILIPNLIQLKQITIDAITKFLNDAYFKFVVMIIIYLSFILLGLFILWIPFVKNLNSIIYKTKNMLSIIPKEILASLSNIDKLLDMDKSTINGNNNNNNNGHN